MSIEYNNDNESVVLHIKSSLRNANLKHKLANEDVITKPTFSKVKFPSVDAIVNLTEDQQKTINARLKLIGADRMKYAFSGDTLTLTLFTTKTGDTYAEDYKLDEAVTEDFELVTPATGFSLLPAESSRSRAHASADAESSGRARQRSGRHRAGCRYR